MMSSTFKTIFGFIRSVVERQIPILSKSPSLQSIYNYHLISEQIATSGQPNELQLHEIVNAGYRTVINLAPTSMLENSVVEERLILEQRGAHYIHIPVDFKNPTEEDFQEFSKAMKLQESNQVWVHCAANMRVSAFVYRYRISELGHDAETAQHDLLKIWKPMGVWKQFIEQ